MSIYWKRHGTVSAGPMVSCKRICYACLQDLNSTEEGDDRCFSVFAPHISRLHKLFAGRIVGGREGWLGSYVTRTTC
ncbi:hypothetical protein BAUCODRAFT_377243 [Baudoinia panamericana UAMH 10762]|uniref:Uncharacterized protein n=1 Tax=Baudoinia panamericana (strain UAMH 10762) TaxID=717646 RepID=M2LVI9_BAUPA|nr:uncharacterized protein BAUCODRAFT_377243 [Baudoinia panamericana UAMH 10762]EMC98662.1 hypothetical protein BAUCODRAFT_377243 [Baudoinia panamericana UAMH 10762]